MTIEDIKELGLPNYEEIQRAFMETDHYNHCHRSGIEWQDGAEWMRGVAVDAIKNKEQEMIDKACEYLRKEYQQMNAIINRLCVKDKGDLIKVEASVESFRKAMEE